MTIRLHNFEIMHFENSMLIASQKGVHRIESAPLKKALLDIKQGTPSTLLEVNTKAILQSHGLEEDAFEFVKTLTPYSCDEIPPYFDRVIILHDLDNSELLNRLVDQEDFSCSVAVRPLYSDAPYASKDDRALFIFIVRGLNTQKLKSYYFQITKTHPNAGLYVYHFRSDVYYRSGLYVPEISNPCFFCEIDRAHHYQVQKNSSTTWARLLEFCIERNLSIPSVEPSYFGLTLALGFTLQNIRNLTEPVIEKKFQDTNTFPANVDLTTGQIKEEVSTHWHMCDCLREGL